MVAPLAVRGVELPEQKLGAAGAMVTVGPGATVIVTVAVPVHPKALVAVTVYVVVTVGEAVVLAQVGHPSVAAGAHEYDTPPVAVIVAVCEGQIVAGGPAVGVGFGLTVTQTALDVATLQPVTTAW